MSYDTLPRDMQLRIVSKFDIDTRIKCGIIHKLKIPNQLQSQLNNVFSKIQYKRDGTEIHIGSQYIIFTSKALSSRDYCKCIVHVHPNNSISCFYLNSHTGTWISL